MTDAGRQSGRANKLLLIALLLFIVLPVFAVAGWVVWLASAEQPWLMSFGFVLVVLFLLMLPMEFWLKRQQWFRRMAGGGRFQGRLIKYLTFYIPCLIVVGVNDLDHKIDFTDNLREYVVTIFIALMLLIVLESLFEAAERYWRSRRKQGASRR